MRKFRIGKLLADEALAGRVDVLAGNLEEAKQKLSSLLSSGEARELLKQLENRK